MERSWYMKLFLVLGVTGLCVYLLYPSYFYFYQATKEQKESREKFCAALPSWASCSKFQLGLDLQGGVHLVMGVRVDKALEQRSDRLADALREALKTEKIAFSRIDRPKNSADIVLTVPPGTDMAQVEKYLAKDFGVTQITHRGEGTLTLALVKEEADYVQDNAVEQAIKTIRNRADKLGLTEPTIARRGTDSIVIQLPGAHDPQHAIDVIGRTAQLQFVMVDEAGSAVFDSIPDTELPEGVTKKEYSFEGPNNQNVREVYYEFPAHQRDTLFKLLEAKIPDNRSIGYGQVGTDSGVEKEGTFRTYLLFARPGITGDYLTNAQVQQNPDLPADYYVTMTFDPKGAQIFEKLTEENVRRHMAIVLDGKVNSAPVIQEKIGGGTARITLGGFGDPRAKFQEAKDLALVLKAGALPAPVEVREKREVGKTMGEESVRRGLIAVLLGTLLVFIFMASYYHLSGMWANVALFLNALMILACMAIFNATLTLPGMAGIVLTLAMAVDANVIINERIREELRIGKTARAAVEAGYDKAFSAIFDSNITTIIAGVVLMQYGSGPVRGFAVTLIIGVSCSLFTAIVVTRLIYDLLVNGLRVQRLSI